MNIAAMCMKTSCNGYVIDVVKERNKIIIAWLNPKINFEVFMIQEPNGTIKEYWINKTNHADSPNGLQP